MYSKLYIEYLTTDPQHLMGITGEAKWPTPTLDLESKTQVKRAKQRAGRTVANTAFHSIHREAGLVGLHGIFSYSGLL